MHMKEIYRVTSYSYLLRMLVIPIVLVIYIDGSVTDRPVLPTPAFSPSSLKHFCWNTSISDQMSSKDRRNISQCSSLKKRNVQR